MLLDGLHGGAFGDVEGLNWAFLCGSPFFSGSFAVCFWRYVPDGLRGTSFPDVVERVRGREFGGWNVDS